MSPLNTSVIASVLLAAVLLLTSIYIGAYLYDLILVVMGVSLTMTILAILFFAKYRHFLSQKKDSS